MTTAVRRATPLLAALLLLVLVVGSLGRSCARHSLRSRTFVGAGFPARLP